MIELPEKIQEAIQNFSRLPGVGEKTATRQILQIAQWDKAQIQSLGESLLSLLGLKYCSDCGAYADENICKICKAPDRGANGLLCVVEGITDLMAIERSNNFKGLFHILGGVLNPLLGIGPDNLRIHRLLERIQSQNINEVILAINPTVEGDATCSYLRSVIPQEVGVHRIGFGIPMGGNLEYLDPMTISKAFENRTLF